MAGMMARLEIILTAESVPLGDAAVKGGGFV